MFRRSVATRRNSFVDLRTCGTWKSATAGRQGTTPSSCTSTTTTKWRKATRRYLWTSCSRAFSLQRRRRSAGLGSPCCLEGPRCRPSRTPDSPGPRPASRRKAAGPLQPPPFRAVSPIPCPRRRHPQPKSHLIRRRSCIPQISGAKLRSQLHLRCCPLEAPYRSLKVSGPTMVTRIWKPRQPEAAGSHSAEWRQRNQVKTSSQRRETHELRPARARP